MFLTCNGVYTMGTMIQIRHVPEDIHKALKNRAVKNGMSLSEYVLRELIKIVERPTLEEILGRIEKRERTTVQESSVDAVRAQRQTR